MILIYLLISLFCCSCRGQYVTEIDDCIRKAVTIQPEYNITQNNLINGTCGFLMRANEFIVVQPVLVNISEDARIRLYLLTGNMTAPTKVKIYEYYNRFLFRDLMYVGMGYQQFALVVLSKNASNNVGNFQFVYKTTCQIEMIAEDYPKFMSPNFFPRSPTLTNLLGNNTQSYQSCTYRVSSRTKKSFSIIFDNVLPNNYNLYANNTYIYGPVKIAVLGDQKFEFTFNSYSSYSNKYGFSGTVEMSYQSISLLPIDGNPMRGIPVLSYLGANYTIQYGSLSLFDGHVLCQNLGYGTVKSIRQYKNETGINLVYPTFNCYGSEKLLSQCADLDGKKLYYQKYYYKSPVTTNITCSENFNLRMVNGDNNSGMVQVKIGRRWTYLCADNMDASAADTICMEMGFKGALYYDSYSGNSSNSNYYNSPDGDYYQYHYNSIMQNIRCNSNTKLKNCNYRIAGSYEDYISASDSFYTSYYANQNSGTNSFYSIKKNLNLYYWWWGFYCYGSLRISCNTNTSYYLNPGHFQGYLIYNYSSMVCSNNNTKNNMEVYCRYLGYPGARKSYSNQMLTVANSLINLKCNGYEQSPADCYVDRYTNCPSMVPVGVICQDVALAGGLSPNEGRVEVYYKGKKGLLCDDSFNMNSGNVICRQLGYAYADNVTSNAGYLYGYGNGNFLLDTLYCYGYEDSIYDCPTKYWQTRSCYGNDIAGLVCRGNSSSCGQVSVQEYNWISSNGYNTTFGANPWQARLIPSSVNEWCSATIVNKNWLLTSANCFTMSATNFYISVMSSKSNYDSYYWTSTNYIQSVYTHPQYSTVTGDYNLALVKVSNSIIFDSYVQPLCLPTGYLSLDGLECKTTGWNHGLNTYSRPLLGKSVLIRNNSYCKSQTQFDDNKMARYLCSDNNMEPYAYFNGESGGPLTCSINGQNVLVGVVARSISGARATSIRLFTRIDYWADWIKTTIKNNL